ncbi:hypothetical protein F2Q70_00031360 [Brassica cretica]|uniref:Uncharacterized protein n=1 Tax=Brassica cretica TaxID=69181 RepID=A0A8S9FPY1_BRACR|nr:hypothetical protein F2Q70_00031360 [Brassica cretica]KAF2550451.1 hypothetical protein F2Q68_00035783 [Brassica cretica]
MCDRVLETCVCVRSSSSLFLHLELLLAWIPSPLYQPRRSSLSYILSPPESSPLSAASEHRHEPSAKQEYSFKRFAAEHSPKWLQQASTAVAGKHPGAPLEEDVDRSNLSYLDRVQRSNPESILHKMKPELRSSVGGLSWLPPATRHIRTAETAMLHQRGCRSKGNTGMKHGRSIEAP